MTAVGWGFLAGFLLGAGAAVLVVVRALLSASDSVDRGELR